MAPSLVLAIVVVVIVAVAAGGLEAWRSARPTRPATGRGTLIVGDSVTFLAAGQLNRRLGSTYDIIAEPGYRSDELLPLLREEMARPTGAAARRNRIALLVGYNDVLQGVAEDSKALPVMIQASSRFRCAVWLALPSRPGGRAAGNRKFVAAQADAWNRQLVTEAGKYPNVHVANDWSDAVDGPGGQALLELDGVHPVVAGQARLAAAYERALARDCG
ncbi:MAG: hypothetical protein JWM89_2713 [Acidimicrobiales bacterium]|nr:hypothetical protein [Acidimicrobiales bacterium]